MSDIIDADFIQKIGEMIEQLQASTKEAVSLTEPEINAIIHRNVTDSRTVETLLDRLLDYAGSDDKGLFLFKRLLRCYVTIHPCFY